MMLKFNHFDTRLNQWLHTDGNTNNPDSVLTEKLDNTLLEFFFPDKEFSFGQMDEYSTPEDLKNHPAGHMLLFSSKSRLLYSPPECLETVEKLCPDRKDRGAYGSIFLGGCKNAIHEKLNILVVDDATGANRGILPDAVAYHLVGDCYGQISPQLYDRLTGRQTEERYRVIQHRFGWRSHDSEDIHYRFGKGTLRPHNLTALDFAEPSNQPQIDLILPLSSFKGTDKDNPNAPIKPQIEPGLYSQTIWLGEKSQSQQGKTAISQLIASFPQGIKDIAEELEAQAIRLAQIQDDPRKVAQLYCEQYEKRKAIASQQRSLTDIAETPADLEALEVDGNLDDYGSNSEKNDLFVYRLIKADLQGHCQLLETEKVKQELSRFVQKQWRDIAIGRTLSFDRGTIIPSKELKNGEICVPWFDEGEKVLNFRSPFLNSNGLCVSVNKHVEDYIGPDGRPLEGIIVVNDEDRKRIQERIAALKAQGIETHEVDPAQTESERQGRDFDGDCIGVELACNYPNLTAETEERNLPENAYAPTLKLKKQSFYSEDGTQPQFEEITIFMSDSISVGVINNQVTALEALESEIEILKTYGNFQQQLEYLDSVANHYQKLLAQESKTKNPKSIREEYRARMKEIVSLASVENRTPAVVEQALSINRSIYRNLIEEGCFQNQIAVDMFKSARAPDMELIQENKRYLYRDVSYIKDKKLPFAYLNEAIAPGGYSPVELLITQTNKYFQQSQLESRPIVQFQDLFKDVEFTPQQKLAAILAKQEFDQKFNEATRLEQRRQTEQGPYAIVQTKGGAQLEITNLTHYGHPSIWKAQTLNLKLEEIPEQQLTPRRSHRLLAVAQIDGEMENGQPKYCPLGTVSQQSAIDYKLRAGMTSIGATLVDIKPQLKPSQIKLLFRQANAIAESFRATIPESERLSAAAAAWSISATREDELEKKSKNFQQNQEIVSDNNEEQQQEDTRRKVSNFVFAAFPEEILSRLNQLQFANLKITGIGKEGDRFQQKLWNLEEKHEIEIRPSDRPVGDEQHNTIAVFVKNNDGEYREYAVLEQRTGRLPIGTKAQASIMPGEAYTVKATLAEAGNAVEFTIREISKFSHAERVFNSERVILSVGQVPIPNETLEIKLGERTLGQLDADSIQALRQANYLNQGNFLKLKLRTIEDSRHEGAFVIGELPNGNLLRINKINYYDFKGEEFQGRDYSIGQIEIPQAKVRDVVFLDRKPLGVLFYKQDKEALKQLGILQPGQQVAVECTLQSNFSHAFVRVDPATVQYPEVWTKQKVSNAKVADQDATLEKSELFLLKIKERPTILFANPEDRVLGLVGLAVDNHKAEVVDNWLRSRSIEFSPVSSQEVPLETQKGLTVRYLFANSIKHQDMEALKAKVGAPLDASTYNSCLGSLPSRPQPIVEKPINLVKSQSLNNQAPQAQAVGVMPASKDQIHQKQSIQKVAAIPNSFATPTLNGKYSTLHQRANGKRQVSQFIEQQRLLCRQLYEQLSRQVRQSHGFSNASNWEVDLGVALLVLKESSDVSEVGRVLSQSNQLQEWKAALPEEEYKTRGKVYIEQVYSQAHSLLETQQHINWEQEL